MNQRDVIWPAKPGDVKLNDFFTQRIQLGVDHLLKKLDYTAMVDYFRDRPNPFAAGEFWGKIMRAACMTYRYNGDPALLEILRKTVADLISTQTPDGCISTRTYDEQPKSSDLWERKYVLIGLQSFYEIERRDEVLDAMMRLADYTLGQIGDPPKTRIVDTGWAFEGIESSSILEPILKLYQLTKHQPYLDFARYIVETEGACKRTNIFEAAWNGVAPKDIGSNGDPKQSIAKAYESMSCFEGLIEYFRATGNEHWREAAERYARSVFDREITILGGGGADRPFNLGPGQGEQWNDTAFEQTNPSIGRMMETCVTVTWMKFCHQMLRLTGESIWADHIEQSLYNVLIGAQKPSGDYYDYYQKFNGVRGGDVGFTRPVGNREFSCCTASGPTGLALVPFTAVMESPAGPLVNLFCFERARVTLADGSCVEVHLTTEYPRNGRLSFTLMPERARRFTLSIRVPGWSVATILSVNGETVEAHGGEYARLTRNWSPGDKVEMELAMMCRAIPAPKGSDPAGERYLALCYGPLVLSRDARLGGDVAAPIWPMGAEKGFGPVRETEATVPSQVTLLVPLTSGGTIKVIDYASAGATWDERSRYCTWLPTPSE